MYAGRRVTLLRSQLMRRDIWRRASVDRLTEPLHLNLISLGVALFGGLRAKVAFDLVVRRQHAYGLLRAADDARARGLRRVTVVELGVASGTGLLNLCVLAERVTRKTGVEFRLAGFDTGEGMPPPADYRDHPEIYKEGWFPMDREALVRSLPENAEIRFGPIGETVKPFAEALGPDAPLAFVTLDVDFYSSSRDALRLFEGRPEGYLPVVNVYVDDLSLSTHTRFAGELLAIREFNDEHELRKLDWDWNLRNTRVFKNAEWLTHMFKLHVLDHPERSDLSRSEEVASFENPYLKG
jgi:hypothetical protein